MVAASKLCHSILVAPFSFSCFTLVFKLHILGNLDSLGELVKISSRKEVDDVEGDVVNNFDE